MMDAVVIILNNPTLATSVNSSVNDCNLHSKGEML